MVEQPRRPNRISPRPRRRARFALLSLPSLLVTAISPLSGPHLSPQAHAAAPGEAKKSKAPQNQSQAQSQTQSKAQVPATFHPKAKPAVPPRQKAKPAARPATRPAARPVIKGRSIPPFWFDRQSPTHRTRALALPPLFIHKTPADPNARGPFFHADLSLTFGWYQAKKDRRRYLNPLALFLGSFGKDSASWATLPLLMGYKRYGHHFNFIQFPLIWYWGDKNNKTALALPFFYRQVTPQQKINAILFLAWFGQSGIGDRDRSNDLRFAVAPPFWFKWDNFHRRLRIAPFYLSVDNHAKASRHKTLFPLFHWNQSEQGNRENLWTPLWIRRKDHARALNTWAIPPLLLFKHQSRHRRLRAFTPLVWSFADERRQRRGLILGPAGYVSSPAQSHRWLAPIFWQSHDKRADLRAGFLFPLAYWRRGGLQQKSLTLHSPLLSISRSATHRGMGVWPLLSWVGRAPDRRDQVVLGGLWWLRKRTRADIKQKTMGMGPLWIAQRKGEDKSLWLPPLLSAFRYSPTRRLTLLSPLAWHHAKRTGPDQAWQNSYMVGPVFGSFGPKRRGFNLFPLVFHQRHAKGGYTVIPPLLGGYRVQGDTRTLIHPLAVWQKSPTRRTLGLGGIFWDIQGPQSRKTTLFPLFYREQSPKRSLLATPIGAAWSTEHGRRFLFGPVFGERKQKAGGQSHTTGLFPLWARHRGPKAKVDLIAPLWLSAKTPERELQLITPLIWHTRTFGKLPKRGFALAPLYFRQRQAQGVNIDAFPGFYWSRNGYRKTHTLIAGPFFHRLSRTALHTGIFPLTWWRDSQHQRRLIALPLVFHTQNKRLRTHTTIALPFWFDRQRAPHVRTWLAFPLMIGREYPHSFTRVGLGALGAIDVFSLRKNRRFTGWLPFAFRHQRCGFRADDPPNCRYTVYGSFPLFLYGTNHRDRFAHGVSLLYYYERNKARRKFLTLVGGVDHEPQKRLTWYAGPIYRHVTPTRKAFGIAGLFMRHGSRVEDKSLTMVLPPLFISRRNKDRRWFEAALLAWQFRSQHKVTTVVLPPIFGHHHAYAERKLSWLAPLYVDDHQIGKQKRLTVIPPALYVRRRKPGRKTTVQFPLWWDFERQEKRTRVIPGLFFRKDDPIQQTTVLGPGLAWWTVEEDLDPNDGIAADRRWRVLLGLFGGGREEGRRFWSILGLHRFIDDKPQPDPQKKHPPSQPPQKSAPKK